MTERGLRGGGVIEMTLTEAGLHKWGRRIGAEIGPPAFIGLRGPLGAGKSVLARAVADGAGVREYLPSPTFNIVFRYSVLHRSPGGAASVVHADLYRMRSVEELAGIGWDDFVHDDEAIVLVEWPERAGGELPADRWEVTLGYERDEPGLRSVRVDRFGEPSALPAFPVAVR